MAGDDSLYQGSAGSRLPHYEYGRRVFVSGIAIAHPRFGKGIAESIVHFYFGRLIEINRAAPGCCTARKCAEGIIPILEILQFFAKAVVQEGEPFWVAALLLHHLFELYNMGTIFCLFQAGEEPVRIGVSGLNFQCPV